MDYQSLRSQADQKIKVADHLLSTTYSIVKEPKLLVSVIENLHYSLDFAMIALLEHEKESGYIGDFGKTFESRLEMFRRKIMPRHELGPEIMDFMIELKNTLDEHKKSSVEFTKKEKLVISDNDYNLRTLTAEDVKKKLALAKKYVQDLNDLAR